MNIANNIQIRLANNNWTNADPHQIDAFLQFKHQLNMEQPINYSKNGNTFSILRENGGIYLINGFTNIRYPIADWNDVKVFLLDSTIVNWYNGRNYQTWAYYDFIYSGDIERRYKTIGSTNLISEYQYHEIPIIGLSADIVFRMSKNDNGTVFYEKDNLDRTKVRISDNQMERSSYLAFYRRMIDDIPMSFISYNKPICKLTIPEVLVTTTLNEDEMCVICNDNKQNIKFLPCNHTNTCSICAIELLRLKHEIKCPICRTITMVVEKID